MPLRASELAPTGSRASAPVTDAERRDMCRSIRTLYNVEPAVTDDEIRAAARQFVRKLSGYAKPSVDNTAAFERAVDETADVARRLMASLVTASAPRDRQAMAERARTRAAKRAGA